MSGKTAKRDRREASGMQQNEKEALVTLTKHFDDQIKEIYKGLHYIIGDELAYRRKLAGLRRRQTYGRLLK